MEGIKGISAACLSSSLGIFLFLHLHHVILEHEQEGLHLCVLHSYLVGPGNNEEWRVTLVVTG